jgi:RNA polymerase sigma-70 factor (ECF subfamily)
VADTFKNELLLEKARSGDQSAFLLFYERYRVQIFRFLFRLLGSAELAEDITHDCFLKLIRGFQRSKAAEPTLLRNRLYSAARDLAMEHLRTSHGEPVGKDASQDDTNSRGNRTYDGRLSSKVAGAVASLPALEREAVILSEYEGLGSSEIAEIVRIDKESVALRLESARQRLRSVLANDLCGNQ